MKTAKCSIKNVTIDKQLEFRKKDCLLIISVGQESQEERWLEATVNLMNTLFKSCTIFLNDSLQRYTMALWTSKEPEFFYNSAIKAGDFWLERNKKYLERFEIPYQIYRGEKWLNHHNFSTQKKVLEDFIERDKNCKTAFLNSMKKYIDKNTLKLKNIYGENLHKAEKLCSSYLIEECAILLLLVDLEIPYQAYPGRHNEAMEYTWQNLILPHYPGILEPLVIKLGRGKHLRPQRLDF